MPKVNVASVQQYTLDLIRVSLTWDFDISLLQKLSFSLVGSNGVDYTDQMKTILDSNPWEDSDTSSKVDIQINTNSHLDAGTYQFNLYSEGETIYSSDLTINYMEDVRVRFGSVTTTTLDTLKITLEPINPYDPIYNTKKMLQLMKFSIIDTISNTFYSDNFESMKEIITASEEPITEFELKLKDKKTLPSGRYDIRFTTPYKSRTFSIVEERNVAIPFMTTIPATIGSAYIVKKANDTTVLNVIFDHFIEKGMLNSAERIITNSNGKNISNYFDADRVATTSNSIAGVTYITNLSIPMYTQYYSLEKGKYTIRWTWNDPNIPDVVGTIDTSWVVNGMTSFSLYRLDFLNIYLPDSQIIESYLGREDYIVELNGTRIDPSGIFGKLDDRHHIQYGTYAGENTDNYGIPILNYDSIKRGTYTFILYHVENGERIYDHMGSMDIIAELTPQIEGIQQTSIDQITVTLKKDQPIRAVESYIPKLLDQYGSIDFSNRLLSIADSNVWADKQTMISSFNIIMNDTSTLTSGSYQFVLTFDGEVSDQKVISLQYMETRKGLIQSVEQISLSEIKVTFSETQSRQFLLSTVFNVERKYDGADFTDRFELLENVLKAGQGSFDELIIPMDHEDSFPAGRYRISFLYVKSGSSQTIYSYDIDLGYMTNNVPYIKDAYAGTTKRVEVMLTEYNYLKYIGKYVQTMNSNRSKEILTENNLDDYIDQKVYAFFDTDLQQIHLIFGNYMEEQLFNSANFSIIRRDDNVETTTDFANKGIFSYSGWELETTILRGIRYVRSVSIPVDDPLVTVERGNYIVEFDWPDIQYLNPVSANVFLEYQVPELVKSEVSNINAEENKVRFYFEIDQAMQYSFFENLKLEVLDPSGNDVSDYFDSIQKSNNIDPTLPDSAKVAMNSFNADMLQMDQVTFGVYQFIFYHVTAGVRESHFIAKIDISHATYPRIATAEQVSVNKILITLRNSVPRMLIENFNFEFKGTNKVDHTFKFMSIDAANDWDESLREISSFYIQIKSGYICPEGNYEFTMLNGQNRCDGYIFEIEYLAGASGEIISTSPVNLSTLEIVFREEESTDLFRGITFYVYDENGSDVSNKFQPLSDSLRQTYTDYFDTITLSVMDEIKAGTYSFVFAKTLRGEEEIIADNTVYLPYMSKDYPLLHMVSVTKLGYIMTGDDALMLWFSPALERNLFDNAQFQIVRTDNEDDDVTLKFEDIHKNGILNTVTRNGIEYISMITLKYANKAPLNRDTYTVKFKWSGTYAYMKDLSKDQRLDYILFAVRSISQTGPDTIKMDFYNPVDAEFLKNSDVMVSTTYQTENDDGTVITEVDFSDQFKSLQDTNNFSNQSTYDSITIMMGTRDTKLKTLELTEDNYSTYLGKRVCLKDEDPTDNLTTLVNYQTATIEITKDNKDNYLGKTVQNAYIANSVIEVLTSDNIDDYVGLVVNIFEPDPDWIGKTVDIYCSTAESMLPDGVYRFMVGKKILDISTMELQLAYAGECEVSCFINEQYMLSTSAVATQISYNTIKLNFNNYQSTSVLNMMNSLFTRSSDGISYASRFLDIKEANFYSKDVLSTVAVLSVENLDIYIGRKVSLSSNPNAEIEYLTSSNMEKYLGKEIEIYLPEKEVGYYTDGRNKDLIIDSIHYIIRETPSALLTLGKGMYIPASKYNIGLSYEGNNYFNTELNTTFMTSTPPEVSAAEIVRLYDEDNADDDIGKPYLHLEFSPVTEQNALNSAMLNIMTYRGLRENEDGSTSIIGTDVSQHFGSFTGCKVKSKEDSDGTVLVSEAYIPINETALLPSGRYHIEVVWPKESFFPTSVFEGGLSGIAKGIQSMRTTDVDTIRIILNEQIAWSDLRGLNLSVRSSRGDDVTPLFMTIEDANPAVEDEDPWTDTFYIKVDDGDDVTSDTYTFSLTQTYDDSGDTDDDSGSLSTRNSTVDLLTWEMSIVYLSGDFPNIVDVNNMSARKYDVIDLTEDNYNHYIGRYMRPNDSTEMDDLFRLTRKNASSYFGTSVKIYGIPAIDQLSVEFDDDVDSSLINALQVTVLDSDNVNITEKLYQPYENPSFISVDRLYSIYIQLPYFMDSEDIASLDISIVEADGTDITELFDDIDSTNDLLPDEKRSDFYFRLLADSVVYERELKDLSIFIRNDDGEYIRGFTYELITKTYQVDRFMDMVIKPETIFNPGFCSLKFEYTNEPDLEDKVIVKLTKSSVMKEYIGCSAQIVGSTKKEVITESNFNNFVDQTIILWQKPFMLNPFNWTGELPFLCNILGYIDEIIFSDSEKIGIKFSNLNLPIQLFEMVEFELIDEDGEPADVEFISVEDSNDFDGLTTLADLDDPGIIYVRLEEGQAIPAGIYTVRFTMDLSSSTADDADEEDSDDENDISQESPNVYPPVQYVLWEKSEGFPYMFREMDNTITNIEVMGIDKLKITLEKAMDISLLKDFQVDLYDSKRLINHSGLFKDITETNFFGRYLMTSNERYIMYSEDSLSWERFDTSKIKKRVSREITLTESNYTEHLGHNIRLKGKNRPYIILSEGNKTKFIGKAVQLYWYEENNSSASYGLSKTFYHANSGYYFVLCTNGKILRFNSFNNKAIVEELSYSEIVNRKSLNDYVLIDDTIIIVGKDGLILKGTIDSDGSMSLSNINADGKITNKNLTAITKYYDASGNVMLLAVGYRGTILHSTNLGESWSIIGTAYQTTNFTDVYNYVAELEVENEDEDPSEEIEEESGTDEDDVDTTVPSTFLTRNSVFITGTNGVILLYDVGSNDEDGPSDPDDTPNISFEALESESSSALYAITSHNNTIVAVGDAGTILSIEDTDDGYSVSEYEDGDFSFALTDIQWCDDRFIASGSNGQWVSSARGNAWTANASTNSAPLKSVSYIPNQYNAKSADYFYLQLQEGQEIGAVRFYSGEEVPTLQSSFCSSWKSMSDRREHLNDIYIQTEFSDTEYRSVKKKYYQFVAVMEEVQTDEDDDTAVVEEISEFKWSDSDGDGIDITVPHSGTFYGRIRSKSSTDESTWIYGTESAFELPYMTSTPGTIEQVSIESPDTMEGIEFMYPFMKLTIDNLNENALHYASYRLVKLNDDGSEGATYNVFKSIQESDVLYSSSLSVLGYCLYGNASALSLPEGEYALKWKWMSNCDEEIIIDTYTKAIKPLVTVASVSTDVITLKFNKPLPNGYMISQSDHMYQSGDLAFDIRRFPVNTDASPKDILNSADISDLNYYSNFKAIGAFDNLSKITTNAEGKITQLELTISDTSFVGKAKYLLKMNNPKYESPEVPYANAVKETTNELWVSSTVISIERPMIVEQPVIQAVSLESYYPIPSTKDDDVQHFSGDYSGSGDPNVSLRSTMDVWKQFNSDTNPILRQHIGDRYVDEDTGDTYYFVNGYKWEKALQSPYLVVTFSTFMNKDVFESPGEYIDFTLDAIDKSTGKVLVNLKENYWKCGPVKTGLQSTDYWHFDTIYNNDTKSYSITKVYIPLSDTVNFPGGANCKLVFRFAGQTDKNHYYKNVEYTGFTLVSAVRNFGGIRSVTPFNPGASEDDTDAGFTVTFDRWQQKTFLQGMTLSLVHKKKFQEEVDITSDNVSSYYGYNVKILNSSDSYVILSKKNKSKFINKTVNMYWYEQVDESSKFGTVVECNGDELTDTTTDTANQLYFFLREGSVLDHGTYSLTLTAPKLSTDLIEAEQIQAVDSDGNPLYDGSGNPVYEDKAVAFRSKLVTPWLTTHPPRNISASITTPASSNPVLKITFKDNYPALSSLLKSKGNCSGNGSIKISGYTDKKDYTKLFRGIAHNSTKFTYDKTDTISDSNEKYVSTISVVMANCKALPKNTYNVECVFAKGSLLEDIPDPSSSSSGYTQFKVSNVLVSKLGVFSKAKCDKKGRKVTLTLKKLANVNSDGKLAKSQIGKTLGVRTWKALMKKAKLTVKKGSKSYKSMLSSDSKKIKVTSKNITFEIKKNKLLNPGSYKWGMTYGGRAIITPKTLDTSGLIWNAAGKVSKKDKICWILRETDPSGTKKTKVYKKYKTMKARVNSMKRMNRIARYQYKLCKQCRKSKLISTKKTKACIESWEFHYTRWKGKDTGAYKFFKNLIKKWYKFRTADAKAKEWRVQFTLTGEYLNSKGELKKDTKNPTKKYVYKCAKKSPSPSGKVKVFPGRKIVSHTDKSGDLDRVSFSCDNFVKKNQKYKWSMRIANAKNFPSSKKGEKKKMHFATLVWQGVSLSVGFKCNKKGKQSSKYKKYLKKLKSIIKKRKKAIATCNKCKKYELARKKGVSYGWNSLLFPSRVITLKRMTKTPFLPKYLNVSNKKGGYKKVSDKKWLKKHEAWGCSKPKFVWTKTTYKKKVYTKLKCKNCKPSDKTLKSNSFQAKFVK